MTRSLIVHDEPPFSLPQRAGVIVEIFATYARVRWLLARRNLPEVVAELTAPAHDPQRTDASATDHLVLGRGLGRATSRTLTVLPVDSRCLVTSLVLLRLLARRGIEASVVVGAQPGAGFRAHSWVEHDGRALLPQNGFAGSRLIELGGGLPPQRHDGETRAPPEGLERRSVGKE